MSIVTELAQRVDAKVIAREPHAGPTWPSDEQLLAAPVLYVSADLQAFGATDAEAAILAADLTQGDPDHRRRAYRRLDATWYTWLHFAMRRQQQRAEGGDIPAPTWSEMRRRFNLIWQWAADHWGQDQVAQLHQLTPDARYTPPQPIKP